MKALLLALALFLPALSASAEEPEAAFGGFHRAILAGDAEGVLRYVPSAQRPELMRMTPEQKAAQLKTMGALMPRSFLLRRKAMEANAANLVVSGPGQVMVQGKPETMYGTIRMAMENGEWKVADVSWSNEQPEALQADTKVAPLKPVVAPTPAEKFVQTPARAANAPPVVGSMDAAPARKLGTAKTPCEFKPVMTAEDLENCR